MFHEYGQANDSIRSLLKNTVLGSNGALYSHLDTEERLPNLDNPLFLCLERNKTVLANVTFCRRGKYWYIRYFAFDKRFQTAENALPKPKGTSLFKNELNRYFQDKLNDHSVEAFYAYIDPKNSRSRWMAKQFGFHPQATVITQTFSRLKPKASNRLVQIDPISQFIQDIETAHSHKKFFHRKTLEQGTWYGLKDREQNTIAFAKVNKATWVFQRLPGKMGPLIQKLIPHIPFLNKLFNPNHHSFLVVDSLWSKADDPELLRELLEGLLIAHNRNTAIWWVDQIDPLYSQIKKKIQWGLLDKIMGKNRVDLMTLGKTNPTDHRPSFINGFDFI